MRSLFLSPYLFILLPHLFLSRSFAFVSIMDSFNCILSILVASLSTRTISKRTHLLLDLINGRPNRIYRGNVIVLICNLCFCFVSARESFENSSSSGCIVERTATTSYLVSSSSQVTDYFLFCVICSFFHKISLVGGRGHGFILISVIHRAPYTFGSDSLNKTLCTYRGIYFRKI